MNAFLNDFREIYYCSLDREIEIFRESNYIFLDLLITCFKIIYDMFIF